MTTEKGYYQTPIVESERKFEDELTYIPELKIPIKPMDAFQDTLNYLPHLTNQFVKMFNYFDTMSKIPHLAGADEIVKSFTGEDSLSKIPTLTLGDYPLKYHLYKITVTNNAAQEDYYNICQTIEFVNDETFFSDCENDSNRIRIHKLIHFEPDNYKILEFDTNNKNAKIRFEIDFIKRRTRKTFLLSIHPDRTESGEAPSLNCSGNLRIGCSLIDYAEYYDRCVTINCFQIEDYPEYMFILLLADGITDGYRQFTYGVTFTEPDDIIKCAIDSQCTDNFCHVDTVDLENNRWVGGVCGGRDWIILRYDYGETVTIHPIQAGSYQPTVCNTQLQMWINGNGLAVFFPPDYIHYVGFENVVISPQYFDSIKQIVPADVLNLPYTIERIY